MSQQKTYKEYLNEVAAPNKFLQPFQYQGWKLASNNADITEKLYLKPSISVYREFVNRFTRSFTGLLGFLVIVFLIITALILPWTTGSPTLLRPNAKNIDFFTEGFILGTDSQGKDVWAVLWHGLRFSLSLAMLVTAINLVIGTSIGVLMGQFNKFDKIMTFTIKIISNVPTLLIMILMTIVLNPSFWVLVFSMSVTGWIGLANQVRGQIKRAKNFTWVSASRVLGTPSWKILLNFLPIIIPLLITNLVFSIPGAILSEASLAFIGLSLPNVPTLGNMINDGIGIILLYPRYVLIPSFLLLLLTASIQLVGATVQDSLRRQR